MNQEGSYHGLFVGGTPDSMESWVGRSGVWGRDYSNII